MNTEETRDRSEKFTVLTLGVSLQNWRGFVRLGKFT